LARPHQPGESEFRSNGGISTSRRLYGDDIIPRNGAIAVPQGAGLGLEPRADVIRDYRLA